MENFNKYKFVRDLEQEIEDEIIGGEIEEIGGDDQIQEYINNSIDNECIYYSNCYKIMQELHLYSWDDFDTIPTNVTSVAYQGLYDYVMENIKLDYNAYVVD